ncbi:MAG: IS66 family transposase [Deltaproteobacteria bacterium]|nr:IS66 family transposase [Deltaproteobacteria bacterium]MBW2339793.1 IS66 family transposase [Deltaproteobacteria bacterium]
MTRDEAVAILERPRDQAIDIILALAEKAENYDRMCGDVSPTTPSGMTPVYLKSSHGKRKKRPGRNKGHEGVSRKRSEKVDHFKEHILDRCPACQTPVKDPIQSYQRYTEDIPPVKPEVTEHTVYGYWCSKCKKIVYPKLTDALPNSMIGLRAVFFTAWLHYLIGVSVNNIVKMLSVFTNFNVTTGGLTQAWNNLASALESIYNDIGQMVATSAVLNADETGWRINGVTHWLWCFATQTFCYYVIDKSRGSPVVKKVFGAIFKGILICDFWGAYNKISALAKQRCFYHLFTELVKVDKRNSSDSWKAFRKKLSRLLMDAIRLSNKIDQVKSKDYERLKERLYARLDQLIETSSDDKDVTRLIKRLKRHREELFTFLEYKAVSPYNNHAEQQMRKPVITRKISQQNRSDQGAKTQAIFMTLFRSAELQGRNPVETIMAAAQNAIADKAVAENDLKLTV